ILDKDLTPVRAVAFTPDGTKLAIATGQLLVYDLTTGKLGLKAGLGDWSVGRASDGKRVATISDRLVLLHKIGIRRDALALEAHKEVINAVAFVPSKNAVVSASDDATIILWDLEKNVVRNVLRGHKNRVSCIAVARNGKALFSGGWDKTVRVWNIGTGELVR